MNRILFDFTEMLDFFVHHTHPTGIQRVQIDVFRQMVGSGRQVVPVFFSNVMNCYCEVDVERVLGGDVRYVRQHSPYRISLTRRLRSAILLWRKRVTPQSGDIIYVSGAATVSKDRNSWISANRARGFIVTWMCYDLIPVRHPEYCQNSIETRASFKKWIDRAILESNRFICISDFVLKDLVDYARELGKTVNAQVVPLAHEFSPQNGIVGAKAAQMKHERYVLFVSSLNIRKNQFGLVRLWMKLYKEIGDQLPVLVLVGRAWEMERLFQVLAGTGYVWGKVVHLTEVSDSELRFLYENCDFTVFPSYYEGWGLPVGESLWMGKPCLCSNRTSLPEAGGDFVTYFDPANEAAMEHAVRNAIAGRFDALPPPREQLRTWAMTAAGIAAALDQLAD